MKFGFRNGSQRSSVEGDHYVALLSNGNNPMLSYPHQQHRYIKKGVFKFVTLVSKFTALVIGLLVAVVTCILIYSVHFSNDSTDALLPAASSSFAETDAVGNLVENAMFSQDYFVQAFEKFMLQYDKVYSTLEEKQYRRDIFSKNLVFINLHNAQNFTYTLATNAFADLSFDEFKAFHFTGFHKSSGLRVGSDQTDWSLLDIDEPSLPNVLSWKDKGCVSSVKDQRKCGSCWAFSAAGAAEGAYCVKNGKLTSLSEQQMVDCAGPEGNDGCNGGEMDDAFQYIIDHGGLCTESSYPYTGKDGHCKDDQCSEVVSIHGFADVPKRNSKALKAAVALKGPVSVAIQADQIAFQFYSSGVFDSPCGTTLNHGVLTVGYGVDGDSEKEYWLIKNSWGPAWGENGFMKMVRNDNSRSGKCGILLDASYPIVD